MKHYLETMFKSAPVMPGQRKCFFILIVLVATCILSSCAKPTPPAPSQTDQSIIKFTILQMNDIYEIGPVSGGRQGGLARLATLRKELIAENPNTLTVMAGDLFSPSALGTAKVDGERLAGKQIVAVMNKLGLDYITFGNHEFDIKVKAFHDRLAESQFTWISSNVFDRNHAQFPGVRESIIIELQNQKGNTVRLGMFGLTIPSNIKDYVTYDPPLETAKSMVDKLRGEVDILVALTHLPIKQDTAIASLKGIDLILGGHEHENHQLWRGPDFTPIFKADANARTVYIHRITFNTLTGKIDIRSELRKITDSLKPDPDTAAEVSRWNRIGFEAFIKNGFTPEQVIAHVPETLDGLEANVRTRQTNLTRLIAKAILRAVPGADLAVYNGGSVRIDDLIPPGPLTQYDILRILPFSGKVCEAAMQGDLLVQVLNQGEANSGNGGFLQTAGVTKSSEGQWLIYGSPVDPYRIYLVATNNFLLSGREHNLDFFSSKNPSIKANCLNSRDIRLIVKDYLADVYGQK